MAAKKKQTKNYTYAAGKRRSSSARVRLHKGDKESTVNGAVIGKYFPGKVAATKWQKPFTLTDTQKSHYITAKVVGGGKVGQLDAVVHATAKALSSENEKKYRPVLKTAGLLTRDARKKERRMVGTGGRARKQKQSPKR